MELPYDEEFKTGLDTIEDVVLPLQTIEGNRVDVLVEEEGEIDGKPEDGSTLRAISCVRMKDRWEEQIWHGYWMAESRLHI